MDTFTLGEADARLTMEGRIPSSLDVYEGFIRVARLEMPRLSAKHGVNVIVPTCWTRYFADLAAHWRGWSGEKVHESLEQELRIATRRDRRGHVRLRIVLQSYSSDWRVEASLFTEAGRLDRIASDAQDFFG